MLIMLRLRIDLYGKEKKIKNIYQDKCSQSCIWVMVNKKELNLLQKSRAEDVSKSWESQRHPKENVVYRVKQGSQNRGRPKRLFYWAWIKFFLFMWQSDELL